MSVPGHERHAVYHARRGDDLVRGVASEVQASDRAADVEGEGPDVDPGESPTEVIEIDLLSGPVRPACRSPR